ncbi:MAG: endolytic transglycosylase MltG, partial [Pseudomonadota bacterium]|nr:endolytic transglycosylase MltG [Pseudomonadota bacterium]
MWRSLASNMLTILVVVLFLVGGIILWGKSQYVAQGPLDEPICLRVERGSNMARVSRDLAGQNAVSNAAIFRIGADYTDKAQSLKAGSFLVEPNASMEQIVDQITRGGASTCGTEIVYRVGVTRVQTQVRELDPATNQFEVRAEFDPLVDEDPAEFTAKRGEADTRYRIAMAEGVTSWQVVEALKAM